MNPTAQAAPAAQAALQLRDIHLPAPPDFWPLAPGWWVVAALLCLLVAVGAAVAWRLFQRRAREGQTLQTLARLEQAFRNDRAPETLARISVLLRQIALARFPRRDVAALTGPAWLGFLDASGGQGRFATGPGQVLAGSPYRRTLPPELDMDALMALVREWAQVNLRRTA